MKIGTSMAAPYVTGVAALIKSIRPDLSALEVKSIIPSSVDKVSALSGKVLTGGRLLSGDFDGDGTPEFAAFYNEGAGMSLRVWEYSQKPFDTFHGRVVCSSPAFNTGNLGDRIVTGDFDGDGKCDMAALYQYPLGYGFFRFLGSSTSSFPHGLQWRYY